MGRHEEDVSILFSYFLLGISLSAPIGPINAAVLDKGIKKGFLHAWFVALGALAADVIYMFLVYMGFVHFMNIPFVKSFLWLFGAFVLIYTGIESLIHMKRLKLDETRSSQEESLSKSGISGFLMSLSNPLTILFWVGIYGSVLAESAAKSSGHQLIICSMAIIAGILVWDLTMAGIVSSFRHLLSDMLVKLIAAISGLSLIGFGAYFALEAFRLLFG